MSVLDTITVLDHGFVRLVETWGSDERIIEAARMSTNKGFQGWGPRCGQCGGDEQSDLCSPTHFVDRIAGDEKLLKHLYTNHHDTPFEMAGMVIEVQAPIFVFREWHRHRTASYNEMSARYTPLPSLDYIPTIERLMVNAAGSNRQANRVDGSFQLTEEKAREFQMLLKKNYGEAQNLYEASLVCGVPKELARLMLPVGRYSRMRASANLRNWLGFLTLRQAPNAQWEIQQFANAVALLVEQSFTRTYNLFVKGR